MSNQPNVPYQWGWNERDLIIPNQPNIPYRWHWDEQNLNIKWSDAWSWYMDLRECSETDLQTDLVIYSQEDKPYIPLILALIRQVMEENKREVSPSKRIRIQE